MNDVRLSVRYEFLDEPAPCLEDAYRKRAELILAEAKLERAIRSAIFWLAFFVFVTIGTICVLR